jgi:hypothetical protein
MITALALLGTQLAPAGCAGTRSGWTVALYGAAVDAEGELIAGAEVSLVSLETGALMATVTSGDDGIWTAPIFFEEGQQELLFPVAISASAEGYARGLSYSEIALREPLADYPMWTGPGQTLQSVSLRMPTVTLVPEGEGAVGEGVLLDASTGEPVPRARLVLREGWNAPDDRARVGEVNTDAEGRFSVDVVPAGVYTATVEPWGGYDLTRFPIAVAPVELDDQVGLIAAPTGPDSFLVALVWDPVVADLDLHLTGPLAGESAESARFHIYSDEPEHPPIDEPVAQMLLLEEGLQTAAVNEIRDRSVYRFSAFDVSNAGVIDATALSGARAQLQLWWDGDAWMESVSPKIQATLWRAMELDPVEGEVLRLQEYESDVSVTDGLSF